MDALDCDVAIVGAGPAGSAAALSVLAADPGLRVVLADASAFPRDKTCGDGIAPQVVDQLATLGAHDVVEGWRPVRTFDVRHRGASVRRELRRAMWVVPREVFDARLVEHATAAGARLVRHRVRRVETDAGTVVLDGRLSARVVIGCDGANSTIRTALGHAPEGRRALAVRGYAPLPASQRGVQRIVFSGRRQPSYAWCFDRGDGLANVGYGELLDRAGKPPSRALFLERLEDLLPGFLETGADWRGHHLPLSSWRWSHPGGRLLLAGDAAGLVNPVTGEGIYYAVRTGMLAGAAAAAALAAGEPAGAGARYARSVRANLAGHFRHVALAARLFARPALMSTGVRAAARDQQVFDDFMEIALAQGRLTGAVLRGVARAGLAG